jgi:hypothetical protein
MTQQETLGQRVSRNFIQLFAVVILILMVLSVIIIKPELPLVGWLTELFILVTPIAAIIGTLLTARVNLVRLMQRKSTSETVGAVMFFASFLFMIFATFVLGVTHPAFIIQYDLLYLHGTVALEVVCGFAIVMMLIRDIRPRSLAQGWVIISVILGLLIATPLGDMIPGVLDVVTWITMYPASVGSAVLDFGILMGMLGLIVRIILFRERLRVGVE